MDVVGADAMRAAAVHCEYGGMDDGGDRAAAVADIWIDEDGAWSVAARGGGKCVVYADRIYGDVYGAGYFVAVPGGSRNRTGPGTARRCSGAGKRSGCDGGLRKNGDDLVLPGGTDGSDVCAVGRI